MQKFLVSAYKFIQILIIVILSLTVVCNVYLIVMKNIFKLKNPSVFGFSSAIVISGSMEPSISVDDMIIIHKQNSYVIGDIITFSSNGSLITHRICGISDDGFVTKGDANNAQDNKVVDIENVIGRVIFKIPYVGMIVYFFKTPLGMSLLIFIGLLLIEIPFLVNKYKQNI